MTNGKLASASTARVVGAAYDFELATTAWLRRVAEAFVDGIDGAYGGAAHQVVASTDGASVTSTRISEADKVAVGATLRARHFGEICRGQARVISDREAKLSSDQICTLAGLDRMRDADDNLVLLVGSNEPGTGWLVGAALSRERHLSAAQRTRWRHVAAHLATAGRLRLALQDLAPAVDSQPSQSPITRLRAVLARELEAAGETSGGGVEAFGAAWPALASGRWSLVDRFEADGRCVVVALPNPAGTPDPRALTPREREVAERVAEGFSGKQVAYELGLSTPTVSHLLHNAVRKLGLSGVAQLTTVVRALGREDTEIDCPP